MKAVKYAICAVAIAGGVIAHADETNAVEMVYGGSNAKFRPFGDLSGEKVLINDKTYVLLDEIQFENLVAELKMMRGIAAKRWEIQHRTEQGRREWHGAKVGTTFDSAKKEKVTEYADGYKFVEPFEEIKSNKQSAIPAPLPAKVKEAKFAKPRRLREAEERAKKGVYIEVNDGKKVVK